MNRDDTRSQALLLPVPFGQTAAAGTGKFPKRIAINPFKRSEESLALKCKRNPATRSLYSINTSTRYPNKAVARRCPIWIDERTLGSVRRHQQQKDKRVARVVRCENAFQRGRGCHCGHRR